MHQDMLAMNAIASDPGGQNWIHDERAGGSVGQRIVLTPQYLVRESRGYLGGTQTVIPVASILAFHAVAVEYVSLTSRRAGPSRFMVRYRAPDGRESNETWMVDVTAQTFRALYSALQRIRPDATPRGLTNDQAHGRVGQWSLGKIVLVAIVVAVLVPRLPVMGLIAWAVFG